MSPKPDDKMNPEDEEKWDPGDPEALVRRFLELRRSGEESAPLDPQKGKVLDDEFNEVIHRLDRDLFHDDDPDEDKPWIIGDFRIIRKIGSGGMGTVYEAEQQSLNRRVALKLLPPHLRFSSDAVKKFHREAEAGSRQSNPGIVTVYMVGQDQGVHYIAQELVPGGKTLSDKLSAIRRDGPLPKDYFRDVAEMTAQVAEALYHAHRSGVIHRDVKPSNILITPGGGIKVSDFGLAKVIDALTLSRTDVSAGTPYYMSPEQLSGNPKSVDHRADIFSLGVTLYEMLTLHRPFEGDTPQEVQKKILLEDPIEPRKIYPRIPGDLSVICLKALEKKRESRYPTMQAFAQDLMRFLSGDVIHAQPVGLMRRHLKRIRRYPALSAAVGVAALALLVLAVYIPVTMVRLADERDKAVAAERTATELARIADKRYHEIVRLKDTKRLAQLLVTEQQLWPAFPERIPDLKAWLDAADQLIGRLDIHRSTYSILGERLQHKEGADLAVHTWSSEESTLEWQRDLLGELIAGIEDFSRKDGGMREKVAHRLRFAGTVYHETIEKEKENWACTITSLADAAAHPVYQGLEITPQIGLVPVGADPLSGLFEFGHLQTGAIPERDSEGKLLIKEETGLVFVLLPGGTFSMGAVVPGADGDREGPNVDPQAQNNEQPVHEVTLKPFFISKYEMTQGQWLRFTRKHPSQYQQRRNVDQLGNELEEGQEVPVLLHPVEYVDWNDCTQVLFRLALRLPSEAEWEYAARAGTRTVWWTGNDLESLDGIINCADSFYMIHAKIEPCFIETSLDDGSWHHALAICYEPNPFGLYNITGNVWEWCQDRYHDSYEGAPTDGSAWDTGYANRRVGRGGGWDVKSLYCRSACRIMLSRGDRCGYIGLRPALSIQAGPDANLECVGDQGE